MLDTVAFANSLAIVSGVFYLALYILAVVWRDAFRFLFNAQFLGADVASLLPHELRATGFLALLVALVISAWVLGFCWAWLYNRLVG
jgi:2TM family of unknown function (DUF5676)